MRRGYIMLALLVLAAGACTKHAPELTGSIHAARQLVDCAKGTRPGSVPVNGGVALHPGPVRWSPRIGGWRLPPVFPCRRHQ